MRRILIVLAMVSTISAFAEIDLADHEGVYTVTMNDLSESFVNSGEAMATLTFDCAVATTFSGRIDGDIKVVKTGASTLDVTTVNTFAGGVALNVGTINFTVAGSLGDGTIVIANDATLNLAAAVECGNPLHVKATGSIVKCTTKGANFTGAVTGENGIEFKPQGHSYRFSGPITIPNGKLKNGSMNQEKDLDFYGKVSVGTVEQVWSGGHSVALRFYAPSNEWTALSFTRYNAQTHAPYFADQAIPPDSTITCKRNQDSNVGFNVAGTQKFKYFTNNTSGGHLAHMNASSAATVTLGSEVENTGAAQKTTYYILSGPLTLIYAPENDDSTWTLSTGTSTMTGPLMVKRGVIAVDGTANFSAIPSLTVGENAKFSFTSTATTPLAKLKTVELDSTGTLELGEGIELSALTAFTIGGKPPSGYGWFTGADNENPQEGDRQTIPQLKGVGRVYIPYQGAESSATWDAGAGSETSVKNGANWEGDTLPDFTGGLTATFATGGQMATFVEPAVLKAVVFTDGEGFELAASGTGAIELGEGLTVAAHATGGVTPTNRISVPITLAGVQAWTVGESAVLELCAPIASTAPSELAFGGKGSVLIHSTNDFTGTLILSNASTVVYAERGAFGTATEGSKILLRNDLGAKLTLSGTTMEKDFQLTKPSGNNQGGITFAAGVTNVFAGRFTTGANWTPSLRESQYVKFAGGGNFATYFRPVMYGSVLEFSDVPVTIGTGYKLNGGVTVFSVSSNSVQNLEFEQNSTLSLKVKDAFKDNPDLWFLKHTGVNPVPILVHGNDQTLGSLTIDNPYAYIMTPDDAPAVLTIVQSKLDVAPVGEFFQGPISIVKKGVRTMTFNGTMKSTGNRICVEEGMLAFGASGKWLSATNVTVCGSTAVLSVTNSAALPRSCTIRVEDGGKIDVAAGTLVRAKELWFGGQRICGTYTAADYPDYISGEGTVRGAGSGYVVVIR